MTKLPWAGLSIVAAVAALNLVFVGCGSESSEDIPNGDDAGDESSSSSGGGASSSGGGASSSGGGASSSGGGASSSGDGGNKDVFVPDGATCRLTGQQCAKSLDCCTQNCAIPDGGTAGVCASPIVPCKEPGKACATGPECCTGSCVNNVCSNKQCVPDTPTPGNCTVKEECCSGNCTAGKCVPLANGTCRTDGNPCTMAAECCSKQCMNGVCGNASFCTQNGDICSNDFECCGGNCLKAAGATYGRCEPLPSGGGCNPTGTVCGATVDGGAVSACDNTCCSKACGPYGPTGVKICQPPSGCRPEYEVCRDNAECCGQAPNPTGGLPADKQPVCQKPAGEPFGRCTKANQCDPPGAICKLAACGVDNRCCDPVGAPSPSFCQNDPANCCKYDSLGIPRCIYAVRDCTTKPVGETCATSADCCGLPCVDNKCGSTCVGKGGSCTNDSDCCPGLPCTIEPGSNNGICGGIAQTDGGVTPPPEAGADAAPDAAVDAATCAYYGQACTQASDCCNAVPCNGNVCRYP